MRKIYSQKNTIDLHPIPLSKKISLNAVLKQNEPEVKTYLTGLTTPLSAGQITKLNTLAKALKTGLGISALSDVFDLLYLLAGETAESSLRNLAKNLNHAVAVNSPAFTALQGFKGNGTSSYLNTGYNPVVEGVRFTLNSASMGAYSRTNVSQNQVEFGNQQSYVLFDYSGTGWHTINSTDGAGTAITPSLGMAISVRESSTVEKKYHNGALHETYNTASAVILSDDFYIGARNTSSTASLFSTKELSFAFAGAKLTLAQQLVITNAFEAYMDSNGKGVIA